MRTLSNWLLAGALAASLTWNWRLVRGAEAEPAPAPGTSLASGASCSGEGCMLDPGELALDPKQKAALDQVCRQSCGESDRLEQRADELQRELLASLSADTVDPAAAEKLVNEVGDLRRRSLASCVKGILGVRSVLSPEEVRTLLENCEHTRLKDERSTR